MFPKFGRGRLNSDGERHARFYGVGRENFAIFDIVSHYISVMVRDCHMITQDDLY